MPACILTCVLASSAPAAAAPPMTGIPAPPGPDLDPPAVEGGAEADATVVQVEVAPLEGATRLDADGLVAAEHRAYALYMEGVHALEGDDPDLAIERWTEAVSVLPDERPYARSRGALALRLVAAHDLRFRHDGDLDDLRRQRALLSGWQVRLPEMFPDDPAARRQRHDAAQARIDEIDAELERIEGEHGSVEEQIDRSLRGEYRERGEETWSPDPTDLGWHSRPDDPRKRTGQASEAEAAPEVKVVDAPEPRGPRPGTGLLVSGAIVAAAGLGGIGVGVAGMTTARRAQSFDPNQTPMQRREQIARGTRGNVQSVVGLAAGGALVATGVALLVVGAMKRKRSASELTVGAWLGPSLGASLHGRF